MDATKPKILIVEDDGALLNIIADKLESFKSFEVHKASDGQIALNKIIEHKPDLILLDLLLPEINGFEVLEKIRGSGDNKISSSKVIILSNIWSDKDILRAKALKIEEYYVKANTNLNEVIAKIQQLLGG